MLKKIVYLSIITLTLCTGCKNKNRRLWHKTSAETESADVSVRDYSVTKANAYNDIFLDSASFEKFMIDNVTDDSITQNMLDFYNMRNFEFAWFDSKGLTEQALGFRSLYKYSTDSVNKQMDRKLDDLLLHETAINPSDPSIIKLELLLTKRFVQYSLDTYKEDDISNHEFEAFVPI